MTDGLGRLIEKAATAEVYAWGEGQVLKFYPPGAPRIVVETEVRTARVASRRSYGYFR